jgi:hypothetical protein
MPASIGLIRTDEKGGRGRGCGGRLLSRRANSACASWNPTIRGGAAPSRHRVDRESYVGFVLNVFRTTPSASVSHRRADRTTSPPQSPEVLSAPDRTGEPRP